MSHTVWARTFNTPDTMPAMLAMHRESDLTEASLIAELKLLVSLSYGLAGFPNICHGGVISAILDESMVSLNFINTQNGSLKYAVYTTASMNIGFVKPVKIPATLLAVAKVSRVEGRKVWVTATLEDGSGTVLAKADAVFIGLKVSL